MVSDGVPFPGFSERQAQSATPGPAILARSFSRRLPAESANPVQLEVEKLHRLRFVQHTAAVNGFEGSTGQSVLVLLCGGLTHV